ncbi:MAG: hypothetical protein ABIF10_07055 [Candidatus Woesearchaeota archaeon]
MNPKRTEIEEVIEKLADQVMVDLGARDVDEALAMLKSRKKD